MKKNRINKSQIIAENAEWKNEEFGTPGILSPLGSWHKLASLDIGGYCTYCFREGIRTGRYLESFRKMKNLLFYERIFFTAFGMLLGMFCWVVLGFGTGQR